MDVCPYTCMQGMRNKPGFAQFKTDKHVGPFTYETSATSCWKVMVGEKEQLLEMHPEILQIGFLPFYTSICTCCMASGFEMFLSEL